MKKIILPLALLVISSNVATVNAATEKTFSQQLSEQKTQLRPQEFNFFSDRYKQVFSHAVKVKSSETMANLSFKDQLLEQKSQLRSQEFNFFSDRYKQVNAQSN